jgi:hypothetical protein
MKLVCYSGLIEARLTLVAFQRFFGVLIHLNLMRYLTLGN